ncbi:MAG TPA: glycoside hydrolase family 2 TIM barrel-domain containing protein, partial [Verrucomicrobiae bacterium]|nr:glycoside hydrolase family 2 TIM barrel-domain containing protein [Verrucomicrobiae bacterium]
MPLLILFCALLCSMARSFGGPSIAVKSIFPFATADRVHIDCVLQSGAAGVAVVDGSIVDPSGQPLWTGELGAVKFDGSQETVTNWDITGLRPRLWSPSTPVLYRLNVFVKTNNNLAAQFSTRLGFRSFSTRDGQLALNGRPVFLRGLAINPPGRTIPAATGESRTFAEAYVRFLKAHHVNIIRLTQDSQVWFDVCDELGMMIYQGVYGAPPGADSKRAPPADVEKSIAAYKDLFDTYARHPSIVIYVLANELPASGSRGKAFHEFLEKAHAALQSWDSTRLYIANAGYGEGREGDICDVHRYWGWYYNTFLTYCNLRDGALFGDPGKNQPITFSECVGNFTAPSGAYNLIVRKQLGAQLNWTGHADNQSAAALAYQSFMVKQAAESFRRLRPINPRLAGLMPFTIL